MLQKFAIAFLLVIQSTFSWATVSIVGTAPTYANTELFLCLYSDLVSQKETVIASCLIDSAGNFTLNTELTETRYAYLKTENIRAHLYLQPNDQFSINIPPKNELTNLIMSNIQYLPLEYSNLPDTALNAMIERLNAKVDTFLFENKVKLIKQQAKQITEDFIANKLAEFSKYTHNAYFTNYLNATKTLLLFTSFHNKKDVFASISASPILYNNSAYMDVFQQFFYQHIRSLNLADNKAKIIEAINNKSRFAVIDSLFRVDPFLAESPQIRELVFLTTLWENYHNTEFNKLAIEFQLNEIRKNSANQQHRLIATNLLSSLKKLAIGSEAPNFTLVDERGKSVQLSDYRGKYVYIDFWATWCAPCLQELEIMDELYAKYKRDIVFLSINLDKDIQRMNRFLSRKKYKWDFLFWDNSPTLKNDYEVLVLPTYYLIDPYGYFIQSPAHKPSGKIEFYFAEIHNRLHPRNPIDLNW